MSAYDEKLRRKIRRENHVAKDLIGGKYRQRVIESKVDVVEDWDEEDLINENDG